MCLDTMDSVPVACSWSPSKLRRFRAKSTMQKLYNSSSHDYMSQVYSQLAMLTVAVDSLTAHIQIAKCLHVPVHHDFDPSVPACILEADSVHEKSTPVVVACDSECGSTQAAGNADSNEPSLPTEATPHLQHGSLEPSKIPHALHQWEPLDPWLF